MFYSVRFLELDSYEATRPNASSVLFARFDQIEPAIELALFLHRYSNCPHLVKVFACSDLSGVQDVERLSLILHVDNSKSDGR